MFPAGLLLRFEQFEDRGSMTTGDTVLRYDYTTVLQARKHGVPRFTKYLVTSEPELLRGQAHQVRRHLAERLDRQSDRRRPLGAEPLRRPARPSGTGPSSAPHRAGRLDV